MSDMYRPLTALDLADALSCFWNAAIGAAHERQEGFDTANIMVSGFAAVERRLKEIGIDNLDIPDTRDALIKEQAAEITRLRAALAEALIKAYDVGFANSGEGYNGEYGADVLSDYYIQTRAEAIALINNQSDGENNAKS